MADQALQPPIADDRAVPPVRGRGAGAGAAPDARRGGPPAAERSPALRLLWTLRWWLGIVALLALSLGVVLWAGTRPGYDPYGWLIWGHLTLHGALDTNGAPSWKPLPFVFTVPYALIGHRALWLWMVTSVAISLSGIVFAARIGYRLSAPAPERRWTGWIAGLFAAAFLLGIRDYTHFILSSQSDTMIVSLCLGAIDCHLYRRYRWAFVLGVAAALGRPEAWPMIGLYGLWLWRSVPSTRRWVVAGFALIPLLWFGIPALTSKSWFSAGNIALKSPRALHESKVYGTIDRFLDLHELPVQLLALLMVALAVLRRGRTTLVIAGAVVLWVLVEIAFVLHGWPGVPRYLFEPAAVMCVLAGAAIGRLLAELPAASARAQLPAAVGTAVAALLAVVVAVAMLPAAHSRLVIERKDLRHERARAKVINHLSGLIARLGGPAALLACGQPTTSIAYQSVLAWDLGVNTGGLFWTPHLGQVEPRPTVLFTPTPHAWVVRTIDIPAAKLVGCRRLDVVSRL